LATKFELAINLLGVLVPNFGLDVTIPARIDGSVSNLDPNFPEIYHNHTKKTTALESQVRKFCTHLQTKIF
jgi:hypothetical protein